MERIRESEDDTDQANGLERMMESSGFEQGKVPNEIIE